MKKRYIWAAVLGFVGAYISSKGEPLLSQPVLRGLVVGAILGFVLGILLERHKKKA
jgi:drug/metabolite transporter (DMT)-like permease